MFNHRKIDENFAKCLLKVKAIRYAKFVLFLSDDLKLFFYKYLYIKTLKKNNFCYTHKKSIYKEEINAKKISKIFNCFHLLS